MNLLHHPAMIVRCVRVWEARPGLWEGRFLDDGRLIYRTQPGSFKLVLDAVRNVWEHRGLPIVIVPATRRKPPGGRAA